MCILFVERGLFAGTYEVFNVCVYCLLREGCLLELMRFSMFVYIVCAANTHNDKHNDRFLPDAFLASVRSDLSHVDQGEILSGLSSALVLCHVQLHSVLGKARLWNKTSDLRRGRCGTKRVS